MLNFLKHATSQTVTENGAIASRTTHSSLLDWFAQAGALRTRDEQDIIRLFSQAWADDPLLALKSLFYFRDVRGGQGERQTFRTVLRYLALYHLHALEQNIHLIPVYGRWDDLYILFGTPAEGAAGRLITAQFTQDLASDAPSLLGKWLKSENTSSKESRALARRTRQILGLSAKEYRQSLSRLRARIGIVETTMSERRWSDIEYKSLPSQAGLKYRQAFLRQDNERYMAFLAAVANGESKINTGALFPYEIVRQVPS
ncbi:DUF2828 family protein [Tumebacillus sp. DT12]|uniref:DUF2828 family protein n=1 Tax=Tumebacillus lacus TaxID=2995335 RepID=A0ABT3WZ95_9BACL|nr:DUF2828 family protein [Tumebacillus lacus]MCX7569082.1 DUF2828 family protein [Tumebacillus lacus]